MANEYLLIEDLLIRAFNDGRKAQRLEFYLRDLDSKAQKSPETLEDIHNSEGHQRMIKRAFFEYHSSVSKYRIPKEEIAEVSRLYLGLVKKNHLKHKV